MMASKAFSIAAKLLGNKKNRAAIMNMARYVGQNGARAIQKSRKRRGKPNAFPKIKAYPITKTVAVPVRFNNEVSGTNKPKRYNRTERASVTIAPAATVQGAVGHQEIETYNQSCMPSLANDSAMYMKTSVKMLRIHFDPIAGSGVNGQLDFGFQPVVEDPANASWSVGPQGIKGMPISKTTSVGMSMVMDIPITEANVSHSGQHLLNFRPGTQVQPPDDWRYWGQFVWSASQCSVPTGSLPANVGTFSFEYIVDLESPKLDISSSTSAVVELDVPTEEATVITEGRTVARNNIDSLTLSTPRTVAMLCAIPSTVTAVDFTLNGAAMIDFTDKVTAGGNSFRLYDGRPFLGGVELAWNLTGTGKVTLIFLEGCGTQFLDLVL